MGAYDYLIKPPTVESISLLVEKALHERTLNRDYRLLKEGAVRTVRDIVGRSRQIREVLDAIERVAPTNVTVLISGESGTGKELVARAIHEKSPRAAQPYVAVNCASLVKDLLESELFGHQKGAFTGATHTKPGKFELADEGTIFLDEVAELDPHPQVKLLRVLQERVIDRVGGKDPIPVDVRVIAATNQDLAERTERGLFREDLYYRLNVFPISIPPLRERKEDIPLLVDHLARRFGSEFGKPDISVSPAAVQYLMQYDWRGNVRELENVLQRSILLCTSDVIQPKELPLELVEGKEIVSVDHPLPVVEKIARENAARAAILRALESTGSNIRDSARLLGIPEKTLYDKCSKLGIRLSRRAFSE